VREIIICMSNFFIRFDERIEISSQLVTAKNKIVTRAVRRRADMDENLLIPQ